MYVAYLRCLVICFNIKFYSRSANSSTSNAKKKRTQPQFSDSDDDFTDTPSHHSQGTISYVDHSIKINFFMKTLVSCSGEDHTLQSISMQMLCSLSLWQLWFGVLCRQWGCALFGLANFCGLAPLLKIVVGLVLNHYHPLIQLVLFTILYPTILLIIAIYSWLYS